VKLLVTKLHSSNYLIVQREHALLILTDFFRFFRPCFLEDNSEDAFLCVADMVQLGCLWN